MEIKRKTVTGTDGKGDIEVTIEPASGGLEVNISSSHGKLFYDKIADTINSILNKYGIINAKISVIDQGALDYVIRSRVETAIHRASQEIEKKYYTEKPYVKYRLRRSLLYIPGNNPYLMREIPVLDADGIILDLENSVSPEDKDSARMLVKYALANIDFGRSEKMVKINTLDICGNEDIDEIMKSQPDTILIPKCESEYDVKKTADIVEKAEKKYQIKPNHVKLIPIIESARGVENAFAIADSNDRVIMVAFGAEDYSASLGTTQTESEDELDYARRTIVNAAKSAGKQAADSVYSNIDNTEGLRNSVRRVKAMGFDGKAIVHPSQIEIVHNVFKPSIEETSYANEIFNIYKKCKEQGTGVMKHRGRIIDMPVVLRAMRILEMDKATGCKGENR